MSFLPTTLTELKSLEWPQLDIILVTGDTYIDSPYIGAALIGKHLVSHGFKVGIIAQPDVNSEADITRLGEPKLFWGVTSGSIDSMVANYTASKKRRKSDDFTPGGLNDKRPDRAVIAYTNLIRRYFKNTAPIVLGGIEASLRRIAHYDFWTDKVRKSILFDSKADILIYGMAEKSIYHLANNLQADKSSKNIPGLCYIDSSAPTDFIELPTFDECTTDKDQFSRMFNEFYKNNDPLTASGLYQQYDSRYLIQNPPSPHLSTHELDSIHEINFSRNVHPYYAKLGKVKAQETIKFAITTHRGCYGECNFCAIAVHQGRTVISRSSESIINEAKKLSAHPEFKGNISDVGGPTANMYGYECKQKLTIGACKNKRCLYPQICKNLKANHKPYSKLLDSIMTLPNIKNVFVASGIRYDLLSSDSSGDQCLSQIVRHHTSGQMKIAPEHTVDKILAVMGKPGSSELLKFKKKFDQLSSGAGKKQFLTYYFIAAHPGSTLEDMTKLKSFCFKELNCSPEQVQIFTPTPSTYSTLMYWTERDPFTGKKLTVEKSAARKENQKTTLTKKPGTKSNGIAGRGNGIKIRKWK
nr:YgiQ family radical SAM protein [Desulfobulbaceae bacterium]